MSSSLFIGAILYTFYGAYVDSSSLLVFTFICQALIMFALPFVAAIGGTSAYWLCFGLLFLYGLAAGTC